MKNHLAEAKVIRNGMGILLYLENSGFLETEKGLHDSAYNLGLTKCQKCGFCCLLRPCVPLPDEISTIADYLEMAPLELTSQHMVVDAYNGHYYLFWASEVQMDLAGKLLPYYRTYDRGYCHFFDKETHLCKIYPVRPKSAQLTKCWEDEETDTFEARECWSLEAIQQLLPNFSPEEELK